MIYIDIDGQGIQNCAECSCRGSDPYRLRGDWDTYADETYVNLRAIVWTRERVPTQELDAGIHNFPF